jgi:tetratricopeptide (TPR) repeat protein
MSVSVSRLRVPELPHRVGFLAPLLTLPEGSADGLERTAALLHFVTVFEHLVRHPSVSVTDPDDTRLTDREGRLLTAEHPALDAVRQRAFAHGRRDELVWFHASLDPARPAPVKLVAERPDGRRAEFSADPTAPLSAAIEACLSQWLEANGRPAAPRPLEAFDAGHFIDAATRALAAEKSRASDQGVALDPPARLGVPYLRLVYLLCEIYTFDEILELEADNPWAIRDRFLHGLHNDGPTTRDPIRAAIETAPMFGKLYLSMFGDDVTKDEQLRAFAMASILIPGNAFALKDYGYALDGAARWAEALRYAERACERAPWMLDAHLLALEVVDLCRYGRALIDSTRRIATLERLAEDGVVRSGDPDYLHCLLRHASQLMRAGRLEEAIALRSELLQGLESSWTNQTKVLTDWKGNPALFAQLYAREAALRGDPGRVIEGFAAAAPDSGSEVAMFVDALLALGRDDQALVAYAHRSRTNLVQNPVARIAGAKAFLANGELAAALDCIHGSAHRFPGAGWDTAHNRLLRLAASRPVAAWESIVEQHLAAGATRLARWVARDAADFVPGVSPSSSIAKALRGGAAIAWDGGAFAALRGALSEFGLEAIDAFFAAHVEPSLATADRLANEWPGLVPTLPKEPGPAEVRPRAAKLLWLFAGAFGRYLAASTQAPSVLAGGYRQVASDALEMLRGVGAVFPRTVLRSLFEGLEPLAAHAEEWMLDGWLLRLERALDLEMAYGHLAELTAGLPTLQSLLRGDEQVAHELYVASRSQGAEALWLLERSVRAVGRGPAPRWSEVAASTLPPAERLDLHLTAAFIANNFAGPAVEASKILLESGRARQAFEQLCASFANGGKQWRDKQLPVLAPLWNAAEMPCPIEWQACFDAGMKGFQQGDMQLALDAHRWLAAMDPGNDQLWKNLGMAYGYVGKPSECIGAFARASVAEAPKWAGQLLRQAGHLAAATNAYRYASLWFTSGEEWSYLALAAYTAEDHETAGEAYARAFELEPKLATVGNLNAFADALSSTGQYAKLLRVAEQMTALAADDAIYSPNAAFHRATALVGMGRHAEALPFAKDAAARNTFPDNAKAFGDLALRAAEGRPLDPVVLAGDAPDRSASRRLAHGEFAAVAALERSSPRLARVALAAARFRFESENDVTVTPRLLEAALDVLARTAGDAGVDASLARIDALLARENALFPVDTPCPLGTRIPREEFGRIFEQRSGRGGAAAEAASRAAAQAASAAGDGDPEVFPGQPVPRLGDYVRLMKAMQAGDMAGALASAGLDITSYGQVGMAWGKRLAEDPVLAARFQKAMTS